MISVRFHDFWSIVEGFGSPSPRGRRGGKSDHMEGVQKSGFVVDGPVWTCGGLGKWNGGFIGG